MKEIKVLDLFAGCGGLSCGLNKAGFTTKWANEIDRDAAQTFANYHKKTNLFNEDVKIFTQRILDKDKDCPSVGEVDLLIGGPPCQGFSGYNRHRNLDDARNSLAFDFLKIADILNPRAILIENVPGMLSLENGIVAERILGSLEKLGYQSEMGIIQSGNFGVPQNRWRVFIVAFKGLNIGYQFPKLTHNFPRTTLFGATNYKRHILKTVQRPDDLFYDQLLPFCTVADAISDLPSIMNGENFEGSYNSSPQSKLQEHFRENSNAVFNHITVKMGPLNMARIENLPKKNGACWSDLPVDLQPKNLRKYGPTSFNNRFGRLSWDGIFNTIVTKTEPYWGRVIHPADERVLSVRECARAQTFPDDFHFSGGITSCYRQIGNAVPPKVAENLGYSIQEFLTGETNET
jgi:DNA (cytosine-5)-methyltransferase 1